MSQKELDEYEQHIASLGKSRSDITPYIRTEAGVFEMGAVFEAETVKGNKNYVIFFFVRKGWVYYIHGDRAKKVEQSHWLKMIDYGDLVFIPREKIDPERLSLAVLGLKAMSQGLAFNDYMDVMHGYGPGSRA